MAPRKRGRDEMEQPEVSKETSLIDKIRSMWEFACVMQFIFTFGKVVKIDEDFDIEVPAPRYPHSPRLGALPVRLYFVQIADTFYQDFESACLNPAPSEKLEDIGLTLLKWISSHRGLTSVTHARATRIC